MSDVLAVTVEFNEPVPHDSKAIESRLERMSRAGADPITAADSLTWFLREQGYLDASVTYSSANSAFTISAGRAYRLRSLVVMGEKKRIHKVDLPFRSASVKAAIDELLIAYQQKGFYYARLRVESVIKKADSVIVMLKLFEGPQVTVDRRIYSGVTRTAETMIDRYIPIRSGDTLTVEKIRRAEKAASGIPFLSYRPPAQVSPRPGFTEADIVFDLSELKQVHFFGGGGFIPDDRGGAVWNIDFSLRNLFGSGRRIRLRSERRESRRNLLDIAYAQPLFIGGVGELTANVGTRDYRDDFSEFSLASEYLVRFSESFSAGLTLGWKRVEPVGLAGGYSRYTAGFRIGRSTVSDRINPTAGISLDASIAFAYRRYSIDSLNVRSDGNVFTETRSSLTVRIYQRMVGPVVAALSLSYLGFETDEQLPPLAELFLVGGPGTIRGYRNEQFVAQRTAFGSFEPRVRFTDGYLFAFLDGVYLNRRVPVSSSGVRTEELFRYSLGGGIALQSGSRSLKMSAGWNQDAAIDQPRLSIELSSDL